MIAPVFWVLGVCLGAGMPIAFAVLAAAVLYYASSPIPDELVVQRMVAGLESFPLLAVPFFVLAGTAMARGGIAARLLGFADALVGHYRGGLGQVNVLNSVLMGGMSGSGNADAAVDAKVLVPIMTKRGYGRGFSSALSAASGVIAPIIPPGIGMIIYGLLAQVSIGKLFIAGVVPGLLLAVALALVVRVVSVKRGYVAERSERPPWPEIGRRAADASWALIMPVLLIVGLRLGVFTPTELGAMAALYALFVGMVVYREITWKSLLHVLREATLATAVVMFIVGTASAFSSVVTLEQVPQALTSALLSLTDNPVIILLLINGCLLVLAMVMESTSLLVILTPLLASLAPQLGIDPVQLGVVIVLNLTIGAVTPPIGTLLYTVCSITGVSVSEFTREVLPFFAAMVVVLLAITFVPPLTLWLPTLMMP